jgi:PAS domain S-box-containing protein
MDDLVFIMDSRGVFESFHQPRKSQELYLLPEEFRGKHFSEILPADVTEKVRSAIEEVRSSDQPVKIDYSLQIGGKERWYSASISKRLDASGAFSGITVVSRDITDRKKVEEAAHQQQQFLDEVFNNVKEGIGIVDKNEKVVFCNPAYADIFEGAVQEITGKSLFEYFSEEVHDFIRGQTLMRKRGESSTYELPIVTRKGNRKWLRMAVSPRFDENGLYKGAFGAVLDITNRKHAENQIRRYSEHLEELVEERAAQIRALERQRAATEKLVATGQMAGRIAHEINNPLAGIKNSLALIKKAVPKDHPYFEFVELIDEELGRIAGIVHRMFDLYREEQEAPVRFALDKAVRDVVTLMERSYQGHDVTMRIAEPSSSVEVIAPSGPFRQVLMNVIKNAVEASTPGQEVTISMDADHDRVRVSVSDTGEGIPDEIKTRIFEPFYTTKSDESSSGLGLGLSVSRSLLEAMGGDITFENNTGGGTICHVILPGEALAGEASEAGNDSGTAAL